MGPLTLTLTALQNFLFRIIYGTFSALTSCELEAKKKTKKHRQTNFSRDYPGIWGGFCSNVVLPHKAFGELQRAPAQRAPTLEIS